MNDVISDIRVFNLEALPRQSLFDGGLERTALRSDGATVTLNWFLPDCKKVEPHAHPFDQLSFVFQGTLIFQIDGVEHELTAGTAILIPPNIPHTAWPKGDEVVLNVDVFAPSRADYDFLAAHQIQ